MAHVLKRQVLHDAPELKVGQGVEAGLLLDDTFRVYL